MSIQKQSKKQETGSVSKQVKIETKIKKLNPGDPILIEWEDAGDDTSLGWITVKDLMARPSRFEVKTIGFYLMCAEEKLYTCGSRDNKAHDGKEEEFFNVGVIPIANITEIYKLRTR